MSEYIKRDLSVKALELLGLQDGDIIEIENSGWNPYTVRDNMIYDCTGDGGKNYLGWLFSGDVGYRKINPLLDKYDLTEGDLFNLSVKATGREYKGNPVLVENGKCINIQGTEIGADWVKHMQTRAAAVKKLWVPGKGQTYYSVRPDGDIMHLLFSPDLTGLYYLITGNYFESREAAKQAAPEITQKHNRLLDRVRKAQEIKAAQEAKGE